MTDTVLTLQFTPRSTEEPAKILRRSGKVPGVLYGHGIATTTLAVNRADFTKLYTKAGSSSLIDLVGVGGTPVKAIIHDVQTDPVTRVPVHVDFYQVRMDEKMHADIPLAFVGESPAVKEFGGVFVRAIDHVKVECLPADLVHEITIDISVLKAIDSSLHISDIVAPQGVAILAEPTEMVATIQAPKTAEQEAAEAAEIAEGIAQAPVAAQAPEEQEGETAVKEEKTSKE